MKTIDLSGEWLYKADVNDIGIVEKWYEQDFSKCIMKASDQVEEGNLLFHLPGSTCDNRIGKKQEYFEQYCKEAVRAPRERYEYIAPLWLQKEIDICEEDADQDIYLFLERVNVASTLWIDGVQVGREIIELSVPHVYDLNGRMHHLSAGRHLFTLRIDNRELLHFGDMASGYSIDTQGYWNGIIGRIELQVEEKIHIDDIQVYPDKEKIHVHLITKSRQHVPVKELKAWVEITVFTPEGNALAGQTEEIVLFTARQRNRFVYQLKENGETSIKRWDEFHQNRYTLRIRLLTEKGEDVKEVRFGMREVETEGKKFILNGAPLSLRGTVNCAQYPLTGYPPMDIGIWEKYFSEIKSFGLNHVRFHAWCPPEAAFEAADRMGLYLSIEMPMWINRDISPYEVGDDPIHDTYYRREAREIRRVYGNHPSFVMFSNGNENMGDYALMEDIIEQLKSRDRRCLYTITSNFDHPVHPCEDYLSASEMYHLAARIQYLHDKVAENTCMTFDEVVNTVPVPAISFEVGQYCVYPDVDCIEKYTGNMLPVNFDVIRKGMKEKGVYHRLHDYILASGDLAAKLYKEDIEAVLRTKDMGGIQLLSASDYTGQSTATVGIMDVFYEDKGIVSKKEWTGFCNEVVPLFWSKRIFLNTEYLTAKLSLYDYGENRIDQPVFRVRILTGDKVWYEAAVPAQTGSDREAYLRIPLQSIHKSSLLHVKVAVEGNSKIYENDWRVFVFDSSRTSDGVEIITSKEELGQAVEKGGHIIAHVKAVADYVGRKVVKTNFIPVFWSPVHFPSSNACGAIVDEKHSALSAFPTEHYIDYQWKHLLEHGLGMDISGLDVHSIVEMVPNYVDNTPVSPLFEMKIREADVLVCGFDLEQEDIPTNALQEALFRYCLE